MTTTCRMPTSATRNQTEVEVRINVTELSAERVNQLKELQSPEEIMRALQEDGVVLTDEQLDQIAGGVEESWDGKVICPCGSKNTIAYVGDGYMHYHCYQCGNDWYE